MAASWSTAPLGSVGPAGASSGSGAFGQVEVLTNTNGQARFRVAASDASTRIVIATVGWIDNRGRE